jgi:hypothetical protein
MPDPIEPTAPAVVTPAPVPVVVPAPTIVPTPGNQTSEFNVTKLTTILTMVATIVGILTDFLQSISVAMPGSKWIGPLLTILGLAGTVLTTLGYQYTRAQVKAAAHDAAGQVAVATITSAADAAKNVGAS